MLRFQDEKNLKYKELSFVLYVSPDGLVSHSDQRIIFEKGDLKRESRRVELWSNNYKKSVVLLPNNFELPLEDIERIYRRRWSIETFYKQLKQNYPFHFFLRNRIYPLQIITWNFLIVIYLLPTLI